MGQELCQTAHTLGYELIIPTHGKCDLQHAERVSDYVLEHPAELVVNCAALARPETCLDDPLSAHRINAMAPAAMALACRHTGARFIHLSTDYVLDGRRPGKKTEQDKCKPINVYGESKREGELQVQEAYDDALILRISWVCGNPAKPSFIESTLARALAGEAISAIADKYSLPTHAQDVARVVLELASRTESGILHLTSSGEPMSWHNCAVKVLEYAVQLGALTHAPSVIPQKLSEATFYRDPRPVHTAMDNAALLSLGIAIPTAQQTIRAAVERYLSAL